MINSLAHAVERLRSPSVSAFGQDEPDCPLSGHVNPRLDAGGTDQSKQNLNGTIDVTSRDLLQPFRDAMPITRRQTNSSHSDQLIAQPQLIDDIEETPMADRTKLFAILAPVRGSDCGCQPPVPIGNTELSGSFRNG